MTGVARTVSLPVSVTLTVPDLGIEQSPIAAL